MSATPETIALRKFEVGEVDAEAFATVKEAHYDWSQPSGSYTYQCLRLLKSRLERGETVRLYDPVSDRVFEASSVPALMTWAASYFPNATSL